MEFNEAKSRYFLELLHAEMELASRAHKPFNSHHEAFAVIAEEFNKEYWEEVCQNPAKKDGVRLTGGDLELSQIEHRAALREELIQTGAMVLRALYDLC
jgi:hypothetical protein